MKKQMKNLLRIMPIIIVGVMISVSCQKQEPCVFEDEYAENEPVLEYAIPVDEALAELNAFLELDERETRSGKKRIIESVTPIKFNAVTRSLAEDIQVDNLVYVINFEQDEGYAIISADKRIEESIIAIVDRGKLSNGFLLEGDDVIPPSNGEQRVYLQGYPMTGDGFLTIPEYGDEVFMNPNTVSMYDAEIDDTLVGNYDLEGEVIVDSNGNPIMSYDTTGDGIQCFTYSLCMSYAVSQILENSPGQFFQQIEDWGEDSGEGGHVEETTTTSVTNWENKTFRQPILFQFESWKQGNPFNNLYPERRKYLLFGDKTIASAGCFPLAIAKLLTYFEYPNNFTHNGYTINWKELKQSVYSTIGRESAAHLLYKISIGCKSKYFYQGTFTFPWNATSYMRDIGLKNAHSYAYEFDKVTKMIDNDCPLIIFGVPGINIFNSHAWNIDGYKIQQRIVTTNRYIDGKLENTTSTIETRNMVHCDFGWSGDSNGYYVSGVFDTRKANSNKELDNPNTDMTKNFNHFLYVVTYEKP